MLLSLWLIFLVWVWMLLKINWNFLTFPFMPWPCCSGKCVLHMYVEVEPGLIAVHTQPEDIIWSASIAILPYKWRFDSPWLWLCEDVIHQNPQVGWGHQFDPSLIKMIHLKIKSIHNPCFFFSSFLCLFVLLCVLLWHTGISEKSTVFNKRSVVWWQIHCCLGCQQVNIYMHINTGGLKRQP